MYKQLSKLLIRNLATISKSCFLLKVHCHKLFDTYYKLASVLENRYCFPYPCQMYITGLTAGQIYLNRASLINAYKNEFTIKDHKTCAICDITCINKGSGYENASLVKKKILDKTIINWQIWFENLKQIITLERIKGVE